eukprot:COSAG04_NODE_8601_length_952_cov_6.572788_1_plen_313_part_01
MDSDDPKLSLTALIVEVASSRGPADQLLSALHGGGETAADAVSAVLDHAIDVLEDVSRSSPRKSRKVVRSLLESVEELSESVDGVWCDSVSRCKLDRLEALAGQAMAVQALQPDGPDDCIEIVSSLMQSLSESGSVAVQCESVLAVDAESDESTRLGALECVRALSPASLGSVSESEASLFDVLKGHLCGSEATLSCEERLSCLLSLFVLGCRNGVSVVGRVDVLEPLMATMGTSTASLGTAVGSGSVDDALRVCSAAFLCGNGLVGYEAAVKSSPDMRAPLEKRVMEWLKPYFGGVAKAFSAESFGNVIADV